MPILEHAIFTLTNPPSKDELSSYLIERIRGPIALQAAHSGYPVYLFHSVPIGTGVSNGGEKRTSKLHLLSGWKTAPAHWEWIQSETNQRLMAQLNESGWLEFDILRHLDVDPGFLNEIKGGMKLAIVRSHDNGEKLDELMSFGKATEKLASGPVLESMAAGGRSVGDGEQKEHASFLTVSAGSEAAVNGHILRPFDGTEGETVNLVIVEFVPLDV
jgi:hypothetical protein